LIRRIGRHVRGTSQLAVKRSTWLAEPAPAIEISYGVFFDQFIQFCLPVQVGPHLVRLAFAVSSTTDLDLRDGITVLDTTAKVVVQRQCIPQVLRRRHVGLSGLGSPGRS